MTRRHFLKKFINACIIAAAGAFVFTKQTITKFVRADTSNTYPGPIKQLTNIDTVSKWRG